MREQENRNLIHELKELLYRANVKNLGLQQVVESFRSLVPYMEEIGEQVELDLEDQVLQEDGSFFAQASLKTSKGMTHYIVEWDTFGARLQIIQENNGVKQQIADKQISGEYDVVLSPTTLLSHLLEPGKFVWGV